LQGVVQGGRGVFTGSPIGNPTTRPVDAGNGVWRALKGKKMIFDIIEPQANHAQLVAALKKIKQNPKHKVTIHPGEKKISAVNTDATEMDVEAIGGDVLRFTITKNEKNFDQAYIQGRATARIAELKKSK
jgi:hypothetical protein